MKTEVQQTLQSAMTVADLIEYLQGCDPDAAVMFACNYGDYHRTQQALCVTECEEITASGLYESAYSHSGIALKDDDSGEPEYFCETCELERRSARCGTCGSLCVDEEGEPADESDSDEEQSVVILK